MSGMSSERFSECLECLLSLFWISGMSTEPILNLSECLCNESLESLYWMSGISSEHFLNVWNVWNVYRAYFESLWMSGMSVEPIYECLWMSGMSSGRFLNVWKVWNVNWISFESLWMPPNVWNVYWTNFWRMSGMSSERFLLSVNVSKCLECLLNVFWMSGMSTMHILNLCECLVNVYGP